MSQQLREYRLMRLDSHNHEAKSMTVTATVGPTPEPKDEHDYRRGVQFTVDTPAGYRYARISEAQLRDLIRVLSARVTHGGGYTATGIEAPDQMAVLPDGSVISAKIAPKGGDSP